VDHGVLRTKFHLDQYKENQIWLYVYIQRFVVAPSNGTETKLNTDALYNYKPSPI